MKTYYALRTKRNQYKFINLHKLKETAGEAAAMILFMAAIWLMMFI